MQAERRDKQHAIALVTEYLFNVLCHAGSETQTVTINAGNSNKHEGEDKIH
jgi:hypothetical protein